MAKLVLALAVLAVLAGAVLAKEKPEKKWSCKKSEGISYKSKLAGAVNPKSSKGKQYPVGSFEICLLGGKKFNPSIQIKQNIQGVNNYNGYFLSVATASFDDADLFLDGANGTNTTNTTKGVTIVQCDPTINTITACKDQQVSNSGYTTNPISRTAEGEAANAALQAFVALGLCAQAPGAGKNGVPKTARAATIAIIANNNFNTPYKATYFTAPNNRNCVN